MSDGQDFCPVLRSSDICPLTPGPAMPISQIPLFSMLRTRMQWHQERQRLLSENVSNADTANYRPRDLAPLNFERAAPVASSVALQRTVWKL